MNNQRIGRPVFDVNTSVGGAKAANVGELPTKNFGRKFGPYEWAARPAPGSVDRDVCPGRPAPTRLFLRKKFFFDFKTKT